MHRNVSCAKVVQSASSTPRSKLPVIFQDTELYLNVTLPRYMQRMVPCLTDLKLLSKNTIHDFYNKSYNQNVLS